MNDLDKQAHELYDRSKLCDGCQNLISLADQLGGQCPWCGAIIFAAPELTTAAAHHQLGILKARRLELGLSE